MAVEEKVRSQLQLIFDEGLDDNGNQILRTKTFRNIKPESTPDQLHAIAVALEPLQQYSLYRVERNDSSVIISQ
ncbi:DUF1659 domain-containing protein [Salirhabdus salicampi]|uniref:DUF1659 domain-containing protein n=1 Tax=Salirhabdus salicampi TaxID=476102 RepID=UPI0020C4910D|nr:DUF1659 domain-containing protein [Salirhabdus salicampi]MCP8616017.1 DUF1659 domain-containing protein [Salirhabdus salicampi]